MLNQPHLKNIEHWKRLNKDQQFSLYDYVYHEIKTNTDIYFALLELFWPTFTKHKNYVFLNENFSESNFNNLQSENKNIEFWMNLVTIDPYFENDEDQRVKSQFISKKLAEMWAIKLKNDFPDLDFVVKYLEDEETGDIGLTFYQKKFSNLS